LKFGEEIGRQLSFINFDDIDPVFIFTERLEVIILFSRT